MLRTLVLTLDDEPRGQMRNADGRVGDIDVLAAGAARPERVDAEILVLNLEIDVVRQFGPHEDRRERRVTPRGLIERRDAHQTMDAGFGRQQPVGVLAGHGDGGALQTGLVAGL